MKKEFKVGQKVVYDRGYRISIEEVERVTPSGSVFLKSERKSVSGYFKNGKEVGGLKGHITSDPERISYIEKAIEKATETRGPRGIGKYITIGELAIYGKNVRSEETLIEVRCCCVPQKLLGWLPIYETPDYGLRVKYPYLEGGEIKEIEVQIEGISLAKLKMAFKSDDIPLEVFRKIPCFVENV